MSFNNILPVNVSYDDKIKGQLIDPYEWNNNFHVLENIITENADKLNANFTTLAASSGVSSVGSKDLYGGTDEVSTIENQLLLIISRLLSTYTISEMDAKFATVDSKTVTKISYNSDNGCFTVYKNDGSSEVIDTNIEKIPVSVKLEEVDDTVRLVITNHDGSTTSADITNFLNLYESADSDTIAILWDENTFTANIKAGSITTSHLASDILKVFEDATASATGSANNASTSAEKAAGSASSAEQYAKLAQSYADGTSGARTDEAINNAKYYAERAEGHSTYAETRANDSMNYSLDAKAHATTAEAQAKAAKSWAVGGTSSRDGEDTDNAKYYASIAKSVAGGDFVTSEELATEVETIVTPMLLFDIDCGYFVEATIASHNVDETAHENLNVDGNVSTVNTTATTLDEHEADEEAHSNLLIDGNTN